MCTWTKVDGASYPPTDREILIYMNNDRAVYFGFVEKQDGEHIWHVSFLDDDYDIVEEKDVLCFLEYPFIPE